MSSSLLAELQKRDSDLDHQITAMKAILNEEVSATSRAALLTHYGELMEQKFAVSQQIRGLSTGSGRGSEDTSPSPSSSLNLNPNAPEFVPSEIKREERSTIVDEMLNDEADINSPPFSTNFQSETGEDNAEILFFGRPADTHRTPPDGQREVGSVMKPISVPAPKRVSPDSAICSQASSPEEGREGPAFLSYADKAKGVGVKTSEGGVKEDDEDLEMDDWMEELEQELTQLNIVKTYTREELLSLNQTQVACCTFPGSLDSAFCKASPNPAYHGRWNPNEWIIQVWSEEGNPFSGRSTFAPADSNRRMGVPLMTEGDGGRPRAMGRGGISLSNRVPNPGGDAGIGEPTPCYYNHYNSLI